MALLTINCLRSTTNHVSTTLIPCRSSTFIGAELLHLYGVQKALPAKLFSGLRLDTRAFASRNSVRKSRRDVQPPKSEPDNPQVDSVVSSFENSAPQNSSTIPTRSTVLQACTVTSGLIAALGIIIRQVSHVASVEGMPILDCSTEVSFGFEMWHLELVTGLVVLISSCRYLLLKTWQDFAESSEAANQQDLLWPVGYKFVLICNCFGEFHTILFLMQVLSSLLLVDYIIVAFLPGISEELLFRGALLPLLGFDWKSVLLVAAVFGVLHLGSGRKYSFAVWASFVGLVYGYATIASSSVIVPMASHAVNNLIGGILWRYTSKKSEKS